MSQINPKEFVHNTAYSVQLPYIAGHSIEVFYLAIFQTDFTQCQSDVTGLILVSDLVKSVRRGEVRLTMFTPRIFYIQFTHPSSQLGRGGGDFYNSFKDYIKYKMFIKSRSKWKYKIKFDFLMGTAFILRKFVCKSSQIFLCFYFKFGQ